MLHTNLFYNFKISILNKSTSLFGKDNFSLRKRLFPKRIDFSSFYRPLFFRSNQNDPLRPNKSNLLNEYLAVSLDTYADIAHYIKNDLKKLFKQLF